MSGTGDIMQPRERQEWLVRWMRDESLALTHRRKAAQMLARSIRGQRGLLVELTPADTAILKAFVRGERPPAVH
jgi:hypothetical protein